MITPCLIAITILDFTVIVFWSLSDDRVMTIYNVSYLSLWGLSSNTSKDNQILQQMLNTARLIKKKKTRNKTVSRSEKIKGYTGTEYLGS